ncbi:MAG: Nif11-like leader peptide family RiPP precursor [Burkholderiales bacterium]
MSIEAVHGFINKVNQDAKLGFIVAQAFADQSETDFVGLARQHGFTFSREEGIRVWQEILATGELSDTMLEAVAGGTPVDCSGKNTDT